MSALGQTLFLWAATAWLHGLCLFALVWIIQALGLLKSPALAQTAWRAVIVAPLISAALQVFVLHGAPIRLTLPAPGAAPQATTEVPASPAPASRSTARAPVAAASAPRLSELLLARAAPAVGWVWVALGVMLALRLTVQSAGLGAYRRRLKPVDDVAARSEAEALARRAGLKRLRLMEDTALSSPIAIAPDAVVLPTWTHAALTDAQRSALLAHEVWHLKRRDPQWRALFGTVAALTLAPHGVLVMRRLDDLAEEACDAWAAHQSGGGQPLAECLAACLEHASRLGLGGAIPSGVAAMARRHSPVVQRVRRLLQEPAMKPQTRPISHHALAAVLLGAAALAAPGLALSGPSDAPAVVAGSSDAAAAAREAAVAAADAAVAAQDAATAAQDAAVVAMDSAAAERDSAVAARDSAVAARDSAAVIAGRWVETGAVEPADAYDAEDVPEAPEAPMPPMPPMPPMAPMAPEAPEAPMPALGALTAIPAPPAPPAPRAPRAPLPALAPLARIAPPPPPPPPPPVPPRPPSSGA